MLNEHPINCPKVLTAAGSIFLAGIVLNERHKRVHNRLRLLDINSWCSQYSAIKVLRKSKRNHNPRPQKQLSMKLLEQDHDSELAQIKEGVKSKKKCFFFCLTWKMLCWQITWSLSTRSARWSIALTGACASPGAFPSTSRITLHRQDTCARSMTRKSEITLKTSLA